MPHIEVDQDTYEKLVVSARLWQVSVDEVVQQLLRHLVAAPLHPPAAPARVTAPAAPEEPAAKRAEWLPVHSTYLSQSVEGEFNPATMELKISTAPWSGRVFPSPTAAACAVVERLGTAERETYNTNGRKFWRLRSGDDLRAVVGTRT